MTSNDVAGLNDTDPRLPKGRLEWLGRFTAEELSNETYHAVPGISKTHLDKIAEGSPRHYWQHYINPVRPVEEKTPALILGDAIHAVLLQPDRFEFEYAATPEGMDRRTKEGKATWAAFLQKHGDKKHISNNQFVCCQRIRETVYRHPIARGLLTGGVAEHSFFTKEPETGELIKCRTDYLTDNYVLDVKSTEDANPEWFNYDGTKRRYDIAVPWYLDIIEAVTGRRPRKWLWLVVEKSEPYAIAIYYAQEQDIIRARDTARRNFMTIIKHRRANFWPDYGETIRPFVPRAWGSR